LLFDDFYDDDAHIFLAEKPVSWYDAFLVRTSGAEKKNKSRKNVFRFFRV
jgi:uncharacterized protein YcnI